MIVENVRLYDNLRQAYLSTIRSLAEAVDAKGECTSGHSDKVAAYSVAMAREMGLDDDAVRDILHAGYLHDIGKIGTPESLLRKEGLLSDEEMREMRMHPDASCLIVTRARLAPQITKMIRGHHERYDGSGYPDGLVAAGIPLGSRILGVADAYDAMISERSYRPAVSPEEAVAELRRCSGAQFDPDVVEAFLRVRESVEADLNEAAPGSMPSDD